MDPHRVQQQLRAWCLWRSVRDKAIAQGLQGLVASLESGVIDLPQVETHFEFSYCSWWLYKIMDIDPVLRSFSSADHERKIREFRQADTKFQKLTEQYIAATLAGKIPTATGAMVGADSELGKLRRELQRQRKHSQGSEFVFPSARGAERFVNLRKSWARVCNHAGIENVRLHDLRHTAASIAVGQGSSLAIVGKLLGHTQAQTTLRYAHVDSNPAIQAANDVGRIVDEALQTSTLKSPQSTVK